MLYPEQVSGISNDNATGQILNQATNKAVARLQEH